MKYEMMFIIRALDKAKVNDAIDRVLGYVKEIGSVLMVDKWGKRRLAYQIKGETVGYYVVVTFESEFDRVGELDKNMYEPDEVIRHMITWPGGEIMGKDKI